MDHSPPQHPSAFRNTFAGAVFLLMACTVSFTFFYAPGTQDVGIWNTNAQKTTQLGVIEGYKHWLGGDYPPLIALFYIGINKAVSLLNVPWFPAFKGALLFVLFLATAIFLLWKKNLFLASILQLGLVLDSMAYGYLDIVLAPALLAALWARERNRFALFWFFFTLSFLIKWQPVILVPLFLIDSFGAAASPGGRVAGRLARFLRMTWPLCLLCAACLLVFQGALVSSLRLATYHTALSAFALNAQWLLARVLVLALTPDFQNTFLNLHDAPVVHATSAWFLWMLRLPFFLLSAGLLFSYWRRPKTFENAVLYVATLFMAYCTLNTGVHENHFVLLCVLAPVLIAVNRQYRDLAAAIILLANVNLLSFYGIYGGPLQTGAPRAFDILFSLLSIGVLLGLLVRIYATRATDG